MTAANRNESELLFEEYLTAHGYTDWTHELNLNWQSDKLYYADLRPDCRGRSLLKTGRNILRIIRYLTSPRRIVSESHIIHEHVGRAGG
jgi:hypothetical protein